MHVAGKEHIIWLPDMSDDISIVKELLLLAILWYMVAYGYNNPQNRDKEVIWFRE